MATPLVAGCAAVLREALANVSRTKPTSTPAALIKALLINSADKISDDIYRSGFGRVNMKRAIAIVEGEHGTGFESHELRDGPGWSKLIQVISRGMTLKATLVWTDPPGVQIKNKLQLVLKPGNSDSRGGILNNNVQQIRWKDIPQGNITLKVRIVGYLDSKYPVQSFAIVWQLFS